MGDLAANERLGRVNRCAQRDVSVAARQVEMFVRDNHVETNVRIDHAKRGQHGRDEPVEKSVVRGQPQFARGLALRPAAARSKSTTSCSIFVASAIISSPAGVGA